MSLLRRLAASTMRVPLGTDTSAPSMVSLIRSAMTLCLGRAGYSAPALLGAALAAGVAFSSTGAGPASAGFWRAAGAPSADDGVVPTVAAGGSGSAPGRRGGPASGGGCPGSRRRTGGRRGLLEVLGVAVKIGPEVLEA